MPMPANASKNSSCEALDHRWGSIEAKRGYTPTWSTEGGAWRVPANP